MKEFEKRINYVYKDSTLLKEALTHSSYANEGKKHLKYNERLEFLGD
ncbi:MAG: ribonuclease III, partial [Oscillospiraceae bacterium]